MSYLPDCMDLKDKHILVTGGGGFLGSWVVKELIRRGVPEGNISVPRSKDTDLRVESNCVEAVKGKDIVIHIAALTGGIEFHAKHPGEIFYDNLLMNVQLMEAARVAGVKKFVSIGSATEYPANAEAPYREDDLWKGPVEKGHFPYSTAKLMMLVQGQAYRTQYGFDAVHLMLNNMFGPREKPESGFVIPSLIKKVLDAKKSGDQFMTSWGTGKAKREFIYIGDAARAVMLATEKYDKPEPVNVGSGEEVSIKELITMIAEFAGFTGEIRWDATKPDGQLRRSIDTSRAEREFGFRAEVPFREGLKKTVDWQRDNSV
jgi:GDP-L-fucose synthase